MNQVRLVGNIGNEPELKSTQTGFQILEFSLAVSEKYKEEIKTDWYKVKALGRTVEALQGQLHKGMRVDVNGKLSVEKWTDKEGNKKERIVVIALSVSRPFMAPRSERPAQDPSRGPIAPSSYGQPVPPMQDSFDGFNEDSIPF